MSIIKGGIKKCNITPCGKICNMNGGQGRATLKRRWSNVRHTARDINGGQNGATTKRLISNACHAFADGYRGEGGAPIVFANHFISMTCKLNGRKVTAKILERLEKMKI